MGVLRRACQNCTVSKRKCIVQLPKCTRCAQKGLACTYDLEPLSLPSAEDAESSPNLSFNPSTCDTPGYCILKTLQFRSSDIDPELCRPGHEDAFEIVQLGYQAVPEYIRAGKPAVFVHPKLKLHHNNHLTVFEEMGERAVNYENLERLLQVDIGTVGIKEALTAVQALLIYLATCFFPRDKSQQLQRDQEAYYLGILSQRTQTLFAYAQPKWHREKSPWQEWLFAESVRRTIIMSYVLSMAVSAYQNGVCTNWLFLESLPFDSRIGLWMAESPQAWIVSARAKTGEEVGELLSSFHEFAESKRGSNLDFCGDIFLALAVAGHNGMMEKLNK